MRSSRRTPRSRWRPRRSGWTSTRTWACPTSRRPTRILFGQGLWTICGSIVAFLVGQLIDVVIFHRILRVTGERFVWLRATASTAVSQLLDSFIVLYIAFVIGPQHWSIPQFLAVGTVNYVYKMGAAIALIPLLYVARIGIRAYLGRRRGGAAAARGRQRLTSSVLAIERIAGVRCPCGCARPALRRRCRCADRACLPQPNIMSAAPMPRTPPAAAFRGLHHAPMPSQMTQRRRQPSTGAVAISLAVVMSSFS